MRRRRLPAVLFCALVAAVALVPASATAAVRTEVVPPQTLVERLSGGLLQWSWGSPAIRWQRFGAPAFEAVDVPGGAPAVFDVVPLPGGAGLIVGARDGTRGLWAVSGSGAITAVPISSSEGTLTSISKLDVTRSSPGGGVAGTWISSGGASGTWAAHVSGDEVRARALEAPYAPFELAKPDTVVTSTGRAVAFGVRASNTVEARISEPGSFGWSAPQVIANVAFGTALYFKDDARLAAGPDGEAAVVWSETDGKVRAAQLASGAASFGTPVEVTTKDAETELLPVFDGAGDLLVDVRTGARRASATGVFKRGDDGTFAQLGPERRIITDATLAGSVLFAEPFGDGGAYVARSRRPSGLGLSDVNLNAESGAAPDALRDPVLSEDGRGAAAVWSEGERLSVARLPSDGSLENRLIGCGATAEQIDTTGLATAVLVRRANGERAVALSAAGVWRLVRLPGAGEGLWKITVAEGDAGQFALVRDGGASGTLITADVADAEPLPLRGVDCPPPSRVEVDVRLEAGKLAVTVACPPGRACTGLLWIDGLSFPQWKTIRVEPGGEATRLFSLWGEDYRRVVSGWMRPRATLYGSWFRQLGRGTLGLPPS